MTLPCCGLGAVVSLLWMSLLCWRPWPGGQEGALGTSQPGSAPCPLWPPHPFRLLHLFTLGPHKGRGSFPPQAQAAGPMYVASQEGDKGAAVLPGLVQRPDRAITSR